MRVRESYITKRGLAWRVTLTTMMLLMMVTSMIIVPGAALAADGDPPPPVKYTVKIFPTGDDSVTTRPATGEHWVLVSDKNDATFIDVKMDLIGAWYDDMYTHDFDEPFPNGEIVSVTWNARMRTVFNYKAAKPLLKDGFRAKEGSEITVTGLLLWNKYSQDITGLRDSWTWEDLKNCKFGVSLKSAFLNGVACSDVWLNVQYVTTAGPSVSTNAATEVGQTQATLNGSLDSLGDADSIDVSFEWGETTAYGNETPIQTMGSTSAFSADLTGLTAGTEYHFRAKAVNSTTSYGDDLTFTSGAPQAPAVSTEGASDVTVDAAILNGYLDSLGDLSSTDAWFEWGTDTSYGNTTTAQNMSATGPFTTNLTGLSADTEYHYRALVGDGGTPGGDMTFTTTTSSEDPDARLVATPLSGAVIINGASAPNLSEVRVLVGSETQPRRTGTAAITSGAYELLLIGSGADIGQTLAFQVKAAGSGDWLDATADLSNPTFQNFDPQTVNLTITTSQPPTVRTINAAGSAASSVTLNGSLDDLGSATSATLSFEWGTTTAYGNTASAGTSTFPISFNAYLTGLTPGTTYYFRAKAEGNGTGYGDQMTFMTQSPVSPPTSGGGVYTGGGGGAAPAVVPPSTPESSPTPAPESSPTPPEPPTPPAPPTPEPVDVPTPELITEPTPVPTPAASEPMELFVLTIAASDGGTTSPAPGEYSYQAGQEIVITASPNTDWELEGWGGDVSGSEITQSITMDSNKSIKVTFAKESSPSNVPLILGLVAVGIAVLAILGYILVTKLGIFGAARA